MSTAALPAGGKIRQVDPRSDLLEVADLVETSFNLDQDAEGRQVMRQIRITAQRQKEQADRLGHSQFPGAPQGFVWEQDGHVMGNVSILPYDTRGRRIALLANVAVAEPVRGRGIASGLTRCALGKILKAGPSEVWLQVRSDNNAAIRMYHDLGFETFSTVVQWQLQSPGLPSYHNIPVGWHLTPRRLQDWPMQRDALLLAYPPEVRWYAPIDLKAFSPWNFLDPSLWFKGYRITHYAARYHGSARAILSLVEGEGRRDHLFLANPTDDHNALTLLLRSAIAQAGTGRILQLEFPSGRSEDDLSNLGFKAIRRLDWMRLVTNKLPA